MNSDQPEEQKTLSIQDQELKELQAQQNTLWKKHSLSQVLENKLKNDHNVDID